MKTYKQYLKEHKDILKESDFSLKKGEVIEPHITVADRDHLRSNKSWRIFTIQKATKT